MFPFGKLTCKGLFFCALVSNTQIALSLFPNLQGSRGLLHTTVENPSHKLKASEPVDLSISGIVSRFSGFQPNNLWSNLNTWKLMKLSANLFVDAVDWTM